MNTFSEYFVFWVLMDIDDVICDAKPFFFSLIFFIRVLASVWTDVRRVAERTHNATPNVDQNMMTNESTNSAAADSNNWISSWRCVVA